MSLFALPLMLACFSTFKTICESNILVPFWEVVNSLLLLDHVISFLELRGKHHVTSRNNLSEVTLNNIVNEKYDNQSFS